MEMPTIHRPIPRRTFDITPASPEDSVPPSPANEPENANLLASATSRLERSAPPSRTRSILNLTSSTLLGIYSGATDGGREELHTPWGTGAQTPAYPQSGRPSIDGGQEAFLRPSHASLNARRPSNFHKVRPRKTFRHYYMPLVFQTVMLFGFGSGFGMLATHLQRTQQIAPIPIPAERTDAWYYQVAWGLLGVAIGNALPHIDQLFTDDSAISDEPATAPQKYEHIRSLSSSSRNEQERMNLADSGTGPMWHSAVRSAGAFVGIAFALRKVPWQSTLQVSLTLAVANPVLWYLIDRSKPGFAVSTLVSLSGTFLSLLFNPDFVPVPKIYQEQTSERVGVYVWLGSILFCFSLCFGAIGRRLQL